MKIIDRKNSLPNWRNHFLMRVFVLKFSVLICLNLFLTNLAFSQPDNSKLFQLRRNFAVNYLKPSAHFALAQYYLNKGDKLQAFLILEYARRYRFPEKDFNRTFIEYFGENTAEPDVKAKEAFEKAYELLKEKKLDEAEQSFLTAANLAPKSALIQTWVGRFFYKAKPDNVQALKYYFNAYFLDPHAYETEYVESRIRKISAEAADARFAELVKSGKSLAEILTDANPLIVLNAIEQMSKQSKPEYAKPLLECVSNDDSLVRWFAFLTVFKLPGASPDQLILQLQNDSDLRKRGLAAYALIEFKKEKSFDILKKMLADDAELIRFDALSALALQGGNVGMEILRAHRKVETNPILQELIDKTLENK